jgi:hypothetical protein
MTRPRTRLYAARSFDGPAVQVKKTRLCVYVILGSASLREKMASILVARRDDGRDLGVAMAALFGADLAKLECKSIDQFPTS